MRLTIKVYEKDGKTVMKECEGETCDFMFGTIRKLMKLFEVDKMENNTQVLSAITDAWEEVTTILGECFPDMQPEDWDNVKVKELIPVILAILKSSIAEMLQIPSESKNVIGA